MSRAKHLEAPYAFISYASEDRDRVLDVARLVEAGGARIWLDREKLIGGSRWSEELVRAIEGCSVVLLMSTDASMRSWAVKQEIQIAGEARKPLVPILLERTRFPAQLRFFLAGRQWIEVLDRPQAQWVPEILSALDLAMVPGPETPAPAPWTLARLRDAARFTDQIWPIPAQRFQRGTVKSDVRGLGAPQEGVEHGFRVGDRVRLAIESPRDGYLLLLDEGPENILYCLCPSHFAPDPRLQKGLTILPQRASAYDSFEISGDPGREQLLAIVSDVQLELDWDRHSDRPAAILGAGEVDALMKQLHDVGSNRWVALSTYFDIERKE